MTERPRILVFASNEAGRHGKGSALEAVKNWGAIKGQAEGLQGESYAIPTKDADLNRLPLNKIHEYVKRFLVFAEAHPHLDFAVVKIGCGLARYYGNDEKTLALMFKHAPNNVFIHADWLQLIARDKVSA